MIRVTLGRTKAHAANCSSNAIKCNHSLCSLFVQQFVVVRESDESILENIVSNLTGTNERRYTVVACLKVRSSVRDSRFCSEVSSSQCRCFFRLDRTATAIKVSDI